MQADTQDVEEDVAHLLRSRPNHIDVGFGPLSENEVNRVHDAAAEYTDRERRGHSLCEWQDLVVHAGDEPRGGWLTWSAHSRQLPTLRRSSGHYISIFHARHFTLRELFTCMGFPAFPVFADAAGVPVYKFNRSDFSYWDYRRALRNSQHCANVGTVMAAALACCVYT